MLDKQPDEVHQIHHSGLSKYKMFLSVAAVRNDFRIKEPTNSGVIQWIECPKMEITKE